MILKFITKRGHEGELDVAQLLTVDGQPYQPQQEDVVGELADRVLQLESQLGLLVQIIQGPESPEE